MANEQQPEKQKSRSLRLDPAKFKISDDGQVIVTDPELVEALRTAAAKEAETPGQGIGVKVSVE
jgi:hypothetical protein